MKEFRNLKLLIILVGLLLAAALIAASYPPVPAPHVWQDCKDKLGTPVDCTKTPAPKPTDKPTAKPKLPSSTPVFIDIPPALNLPPYVPLPLPPPFNLRLENGVAACDELPSPREQGACFFSILFGGVPTFVWDWTGNATFDESILTGYHLVATLISASGEESALWERDVLPGSRKMALARMGGLTCGAQLRVTVMAVQGSLISAPSDELIVPSGRCITAALVSVTFETLDLEPPAGARSLRDLGELCPGTTRICEDPLLELFGSLRVNDEFLCWNSVCLFDPSGDGRSYAAGAYSWSREILIDEPSFGAPPEPCLRPPCDGILAPTATPRSPIGRNEFSVTLHGGDGLTIRVRISEKDRAVGDFPWTFATACGPHLLELPPRSAAEWARISQVRTLVSSDGQSTCRITITIEGQPVP